MKTKIQIKSVFGKLLFEHEKENNTIKDTLYEANLRGADLYEANLYGADLYEANLYGANLYEAKNKEQASLPIYCKWGLAIKGDTLKIGCKEMSFLEWKQWFESDEEFDTSRYSE